MSEESLALLVVRYGDYRNTPRERVRIRTNFGLFCQREYCVVSGSPCCFGRNNCDIVDDSYQLLMKARETLLVDTR
jgi:hypothetical protein